MRDWISAQEIAELGLSGMPETKRNVNLHALREGWNGDERRCRQRRGPQGGGGFEYHIDLLPLTARIDYYRRHLSIDPRAEELLREATTEPGAASLSASAAEARDARLAILRAAEAFHRNSKLSIVAADAMFARLYNVRRVEMPEWVAQAIPHVSARSLARWRGYRKGGETKRLGVDKAAARKGKGLLDIAEGGAVKTFILALIVHQPHLTAHHVRQLVRAEYGDVLKVTCPETGAPRHHDVPPVRTFQHYLKALRTTYKVDIVALTNPDAFRSEYRVSGRGSLRHVTRPNQLWQIDASPADAMCLDGRHSIYATIDIATRRTMIYVSRTPRASAVGLLLRRSILAWGVPEAVKTDNGSDFVAKESQRLFAALDIERLVSAPFAPEQKGHVERVIRTLQHDLMPLLGGFVGHSVADRKAIESRKSFAKRLGDADGDAFAVNLTAAELQRYCDEWCETQYAHRPHEGLHGATPFQVAAAAPHPVRTVDVRALDLLLAPVAGKDGYRTATKFGVRIDGRHYLMGSVMPETRVFVRMDPADLGRALVFNSEAGEFLGEAICPDVAGIDPAEAVKAAKTEQKRIIDERTAEARREAKRLTSGPALADLVLGVARRDASNIVGFPKQEIAHTTPELTAASAAARRGDAPVPVELDGRAAEIFAEMQLEARGPAARGGEQNVTPLHPAPLDPAGLGTPQRRMRRALDLEVRDAAGEQLDTRDAIWLGGYREGAEYRAMRGLYEDFGERALAD